MHKMRHLPGNITKLTQEIVSECEGEPISSYKQEFDFIFSSPKYFLLQKCPLSTPFGYEPWPDSDSHHEPIHPVLIFDDFTWTRCVSFDVFFDLRLNKRLNKRSWGWWFETPSRSIWRHCNDLNMYITFHVQRNVDTLPNKGNEECHLMCCSSAMESMVRRTQRLKYQPIP